MKKSSRKRQFEDEGQATSSEKLMRRSGDFDELPNRIEEANNQSIKGFLLKEQESKYEYDANQETQFISLEQHVDWIFNNYSEMIDHLPYPESTFEQLNLREQYNFVDIQIFDDIFHCKTALNQFDKDTIRKAKSASNPFELINKCIFQNRSALKMANLDYLCDHMFTSPKPPLIDESKETLFFADLCGGPGNFNTVFEF